MHRSASVIIASIWFTQSCTTVSQDSLAKLPPLPNQAVQALAPQSEELLQSFSFGSCNNIKLPQPMWRKIVEDKPQLFVWSGDAVYPKNGDMLDLYQSFSALLQQPEYDRLLRSGTKMIGVYDDHDFGVNNGDGSFAWKNWSQRFYLDFIKEPSDSPRRKQEGIYAEYKMGPQGKRVKFLVLDTRYQREAKGPKASLLGAAQWRFLEEQLKNKEAELLFVVSSIQVLPSEHKYEKWADFPQERERLLQLLDRSPYNDIVLLSGDRHFAEFSTLTLASGKKLREMTSSGLTHSFNAMNDSKEPNSLRTAPIFSRLHYGWVGIQWPENSKPKVSLEIRDINRQAQIRTEF